MSIQETSNDTMINIIESNDYKKMMDYINDNLTIDNMNTFINYLFLHYDNDQHSFKFKKLYPLFEQIHKKCYIRLCSTEKNTKIKYVKSLIKINKAQYILYNLNMSDFCLANIRDIFINSVKVSTLPVVKHIYEKYIQKNNYTCDINTQLCYALFNSDDRVYKYILTIYPFKEQSKNNISGDTFRGIFSKYIPEKYQLRRLRFLSKYYDINKIFGSLIKYMPDFNILYTTMKYNYAFFDTTVDYEISKYFINIINLCLDNTSYETTKDNITKIYNLLSTDYEKNIFYITFSILANVSFDFDFINDDKNYGNFLYNIFREIKFGNDGLFTNRKFLNQIDNNSYLTFFKKYTDETYHLNHKTIKILTIYKPTDVSMINNKSLINYILKLNTCYYYFKRYINKKVKFYSLSRKLADINREWNIISNITIDKKVKFNYIPPYHLLPNQLNTLSSVLIKEKADGELVFELPSNIEPKVQFDKTIKAEYIEDLDLYLVFDIDMDDSIINKYKYLRSIHPFIKSSNIDKIYDWDDLVNCINQERKQLKNFLNQPYRSYRWYPKAAWEFKDIDEEIITKLTILVNNTDISLTKWLCEKGSFETDGFIMTPINGKREIKVKPKSLLTIDLLYKDSKWLDRDNFEYNDIMKEGTFKNNTIYRCYPIDNMYEARDIRFDKKKPNPRNIVNNLISLFKCKYDETFTRLYYTNKQYEDNFQWNNIVKNNNYTIKRFTTSMKNTNILDLGCGNGKVLKFIEQYNSYYGMDNDMFNIIEANTKYNSNKNVFNYIDLSKKWNDTKNKLYTVDSKCYDTIYAINSMMHFCTDEFWEQLSNLTDRNTEFVFNLINDKLNYYKFGSKSYIMKENNTVKYYFEFVHNEPLNEPFISSEKIKKYLEKHNWKIIEKFTPTQGLNSFYTWYKVKKN